MKTSDATAALASAFKARERLSQRSQKYIASKGYAPDHAMHWHTLAKQIHDVLKDGGRMVKEDPSRMIAVRLTLERMEKAMIDAMGGNGLPLKTLYPKPFAETVPS